MRNTSTSARGPLSASLVVLESRSNLYRVIREGMSVSWLKTLKQNGWVGPSPVFLSSFIKPGLFCHFRRWFGRMLDGFLGRLRFANLLIIVLL